MHALSCTREHGTRLTFVPHISELFELENERSTYFLFGTSEKLLLYTSPFIPKYWLLGRQSIYGQHGLVLQVFHDIQVVCILEHSILIDFFKVGFWSVLMLGVHRYVEL